MGTKPSKSSPSKHASSSSSSSFSSSSSSVTSTLSSSSSSSSSSKGCYIMGGDISASTDYIATDRVFRIDCDSIDGKIEELPSMITSRMHCSSSILNHHIIVTGGLGEDF